MPELHLVETTFICGCLKNHFLTTLVMLHYETFNKCVQIQCMICWLSLILAQTITENRTWYLYSRITCRLIPYHKCRLCMNDVSSERKMDDDPARDTPYWDLEEEHLQQHECLWLHYSGNIVIALPPFLDLIFFRGGLRLVLLAMQNDPVSRYVRCLAANV